MKYYHLKDFEHRSNYITHVAEALYNSIIENLTAEELMDIDHYSDIYDQPPLDPEVVIIAAEVLKEEG